MTAVAVLGVLFALGRSVSSRFAESSPGSTVVIVGTCVAYLAYKRYSDALLLRRVSGLTTGRPERARLLLVSAIFAAALIGLSDAAFLIVYAMCTTANLHSSSDGDTAAGVIIGMVMALCVALCLSRAFELKGPERTRR